MRSIQSKDSVDCEYSTRLQNSEQKLYAALACYQSGDHTTARSLFQDLLALQPDHPIALHILALLEHADGRHDIAIDFLKRVIAQAPNWVDAHSNLAAIYRAAGALDAAADSAKRAIALDPRSAPAHTNFGNICEDRGDIEGALASYMLASSLDPNLVDAHFNAANMLARLGQSEEALQISRSILQRTPGNPAAHFRAGNLLREMGRLREAIDAYLRALALAPDHPDAYCNLGDTFFQLGIYEQAIAAFQKAIAINPMFAEAHYRVGSAYEYSGRPDLAPPAYARALYCDPTLLGARLQLHQLRRCACDWSTFEADQNAIIEALPGLRAPLAPFHLLNIDTSARLHHHNARLWAAGIRSKPRFSHQRPIAGAPWKEKLKIGYLSADFHDHATAMLMADLFDCHDREQFEIVAYSYGPDDGSDMRRRLVRAFGTFVDLRKADDRQASQRIFEDGIDILVELKGYTQFARPDIAAQRPAPIQVHFLGYPGTTGTDFIDYIIADSIILPMDNQEFYSEKIVHLPDCYQPNDRFRLIPDKAISRRDFGLPDRGFIFCSLNNSYKITPRFFDIWMRLLREVEGSVLWLFDAYPGVRDNLLREAAARNIDPSRLVFAPRVAPAEHIARLRLADIFLDTLPVGAHTTASEALWAGLPVLTLCGSTFAGRVATSILKAAELPELITHSLAEYEAKALSLARDASELAALRQRLASNLKTCALFDTPRFTRHLERAFHHMWNIWSLGEDPRPFSITRIERDDRKFSSR